MKRNPRTRMAKSLSLEQDGHSETAEEREAGPRQTKKQEADCGRSWTQCMFFSSEKNIIFYL